MRVIYNSVLPFKGFMAINLFGVVFVRKEYEKDKDTWSMRICLHHEAIHTAQMRELWYIPFYALYLLEWLFRLCVSPKTAYRDISFEREAYDNERKVGWYLKDRKRFAFVKYYKRKKS